MGWLPLGSRGFVPFSELPAAGVPRGQGVYVVLRRHVDEPEFLDVSPAGRFKGKDPSVEASELHDAWVDRALVLYVGKASAGAAGRWPLGRPLSVAARARLLIDEARW